MVAIYFGYIRKANEVGAECGRRVGNTYKLCKRHKDQFLLDGLSIAEQILTEDEVASIEV